MPGRAFQDARRGGHPLTRQLCALPMAQRCDSGTAGTPPLPRHFSRHISATLLLTLNMVSFCFVLCIPIGHAPCLPGTYIVIRFRMPSIEEPSPSGQVILVHVRSLLPSPFTGFTGGKMPQRGSPSSWRANQRPCLSLPLQCTLPSTAAAKTNGNDETNAVKK